MNKQFRFFYLIALILFFQFFTPVTAQTKQPAEKKAVATKKSVKSTSVKLKQGPVRIRIYTDSGIIIIKLSDSTPLHRDNFVKLVNEGFYDSLLFHRVIPQFMIQGGDPTSKYAESGSFLGAGNDNLALIPAEFKPFLFHKKGALAAARTGNPEKASSASQFYLVEGKLFTDEELNMIELSKSSKYTAEQREIYKTIGGTPHLDMEYTVFGEVESGVEVIGKITNVPRDQRNRPRTDVRMKMEIIK